MNDYPYDACPQCGGEVDEDALFTFCVDQECGWAEELPEDDTLLDTPEDGDLEEVVSIEEEEGT